jgi:hypothetical protein
VAAVVNLKAEEHVRESGDKRRPQSHEVPHRPSLIERHDAGLGGGVVVADRLVERCALEGEIATDFVHVVSDLFPMVLGHLRHPTVRGPEMPGSLRSCVDEG